MRVRVALQEIPMIAETVQQEMPASPVDAGLRQWQRKLDTVSGAGRKVVLASVGLGAYVVDGAASVYKAGVRFVTSAERRGARMGRDVKHRFSDLEEQTVNEMRKLQDSVDINIEQLRGGSFGSGSAMDEELEKRVELVLANLGFPTRERLERLSQEIDDLNQKIDQQLKRLPDQPYPEPLG
jgi:poly(hydroxyalkanoate) granule-associated protein